MLSALESARAGERRFLADASHELRTPVTTLLGNIEYAARHGVDDELLAELRAGVARLARLVDDLLVLERADDAEAALEPVALDQLVRAVVAAHEDPQHRVQLGDVEPARVRADPEALRRALANLIENGLVHGPPEGHVTVALRADDGHARITVRDEGSGPDRADQDHLFERFWRGTEAGQRPGSGLGLSIVAAIVDRHGGQISVDGPVFTVELALCDGPPV
jgi:signal transduction histidine kinase